MDWFGLDFCKLICKIIIQQAFELRLLERFEEKRDESLRHLSESSLCEYLLTKRNYYQAIGLESSDT